MWISITNNNFGLTLEYHTSIFIEKGGGIGTRCDSHSQGVFWKKKRDSHISYCLDGTIELGGWYYFPKYLSSRPLKALPRVHSRLQQIDTGCVRDVQILQRPIRRNTALNQIVAVSLTGQEPANVAGRFQAGFVFMTCTCNEAKRLKGASADDFPWVMQIHNQKIIRKEAEKIRDGHMIIQLKVHKAGKIPLTNIWFEHRDFLKHPAGFPPGMFSEQYV